MVTNDYSLHSLYGFFQENDSSYRIYNKSEDYNKPLELESLKIDRKLYSECDDDFTYYGLVVKSMDILLSDFFCSLEQFYDSIQTESYHENIVSVDNIKIDHTEVESILIFLNCFMCSFRVAYLLPIHFLEYLMICKCNYGIYNKECFDNMFILSFSDSSDYEDIRENIDFGRTERGIGLRLLKKKVLVTLVFEKLIEMPFIKEFIKQKYGIENEDIRYLVTDIIRLLKIFEIH